MRDLTDQIAAHAVAEERAEYRPMTAAQLPREELARLIKELEKQMRNTAEALEFEKAAELRDQIYELREALAEKEDLPPWQRARVLSGERGS